jgi:hypothetical protein
MTLKATLSPEEQAGAASVEQRLNNELSEILGGLTGDDSRFSAGLMVRTYIWEHWRELQYVRGDEFFGAMLEIGGIDKNKP